MDWAGWAIFGSAATVLLTAILVAAQLAGFTRMDIPMLLGTVFVEEPDVARALGALVHLGVGQFFALFYAAGFALLGTATWWLGALFGVLHAGAALTLILPLLPGVHARMGSERQGPRTDVILEPPGLFALNYGRATALVTFLAHVAYGTLLGVLLSQRA